MVVPSQVDLIDRTIFLTPVRELDEGVLLGNIRNRANNWIP
jgi:hypothetical protein